MNKLLNPYVVEQKEQKIQELKGNTFVKNVEDKGSHLLVETIKPLDCDDLKMVMSGVNLYKCFEMVTFAKKIQDEGRMIPSSAPKFSWDLIRPVVDLPKELTYKINKQEYMLPLDEVLTILNTRVYNTTSLIFKLLDLTDSFYPMEDRKKSLLEFLTTMTEHTLYSKHPDFDEAKRLKKLNKEFDTEFVKFWIKQNDITKQQLLCEHDTSDQFSTDGNWYNVVGVCRKCLINDNDKSFESESCQNAYVYWKAALKNYKVKKEKV